MAEDEKRRCPVCGARVALSAKECLMCGASLERPKPRRRISIPLFIPAVFLAAIILTGLAAVLVFGFQRNPDETSLVQTSTSTATDREPGPRRRPLTLRAVALLSSLLRDLVLSGASADLDTSGCRATGRMVD